MTARNRVWKYNRQVEVIERRSWELELEVDSKLEIGSGKWKQETK
jgi:hypothetical protein